ncbi:protein FAM133-like [Panonychus citri]|uniref:protein FAM133-like n=1 Tax=Panonychus citri TaxID=50023 RepID=UPI0023078C5C|nr:protein FAM133-like [Panonychus citri]
MKERQKDKDKSRQGKPYDKEKSSSGKLFKSNNFGSNNSNSSSYKSSSRDNQNKSHRPSGSSTKGCRYCKDENHTIENCAKLVERRKKEAAQQNRNSSNTTVPAIANYPANMTSLVPDTSIIDNSASTPQETVQSNIREPIQSAIRNPLPLQHQEMFNNLLK